MHDSTCIICRDEMLTEHACRRLPCGHSFHVWCLRRWLENDLRCPTCRHQLALLDPVAPAALAPIGLAPPQAAAAAAVDAVAAPRAAPAAPTGTLRRVVHAPAPGPVPAAGTVATVVPIADPVASRPAGRASSQRSQQRGPAPPISQAESVAPLASQPAAVAIGVHNTPVALGLKPPSVATATPSLGLFNSANLSTTGVLAATTPLGLPYPSVGLGLGAPLGFGSILPPPLCVGSPWMGSATAVSPMASATHSPWPVGAMEMELMIRQGMLLNHQIQTVQVCIYFRCFATTTGMVFDYCCITFLV